ncbi:hypothetical protein [Absidia glauca]|uniref:Uncharacterized protein n=1 Tax=Absidia glauca TaxID=4829 RepID=A0A163KL21_ABSGL|nr:hypothetical protein [Absidia glauca]
MFDKRKHSHPASAFSSPSSSSTSSCPSSLQDEPVQKKKVLTVLKSLFSLRFMADRSPPRHSSSQHQQEYHQQVHRWSVGMVQEYLSSPPPPRKFILKYPPPTCGTAFLPTIPEV